MEKRLLDINEAASYLGTNPQCLRMRLWRGQIPNEVVIRLRESDRVYLDKEALDNWIDSLRGKQ